MRMLGQMRVISAIILSGASLDGYAQEWFGFGGLCIRLMVFAGMLVLGLLIESKAEQRKRAKRVAARKAQNNKQYQIIYH